MIEVEKLALFNEASHKALIQKLIALGATDLGENHTSSIFYLGNGYQLKVTAQHSKNKAKIALKPREFGADFSHEYEIVFSEDQIDTAEKMMDILMGRSPKIPTKQDRHDYLLEEVEIAVKYSADWGYHAEFEQIVEEPEEVDAALERIHAIAKKLGVTLLTKEEAAEKIKKELKRRGVKT